MSDYDPNEDDSHLESFLDAALGLELGHFRLLLRAITRRLQPDTAALTGRPG